MSASPLPPIPILIISPHLIPPPPLSPQHLGFEVTNLLEVNEGKLYQMDMLIPKEQMEHVMRDLETNGTEGKKAIKDTQYHWTDGPEGYPLVPYTFADSKLWQCSAVGFVLCWCVCIIHISIR